MAQLRYLYWHTVGLAFVKWQYPYEKQLTAWVEAFEERKSIVGMQQAWKDYNNEDRRTQNRQ